MSLVVWLPLTKDLRQQGLADTSTITLASGNAFVDGGKVGNKALHLTKQQTILGTSSCMSGKKQMSYAFWVKVNTAWSAQWLDGIAWYSTDGSSAAYSRQEFYTNCTRIGTWFSGSSLSGYVFTPGEWTHIIGTFDYTTGIAKFYINGVLQGTSTSLSKTHYCRGDFYLGDSGVDIVENDVRIYDHCLSPMEVKELAKGLILHYPLNRQGWGQENLDNFSSIASNWTMESLSGSNYSDSSYGNVIKLVTNAANQRMYHNVISTLWQSGQVYTVSFLAKADQNGRTCDMSRSIADFSPTFTLTTQWKRYSGKITSTATPGGGTLSFRINQSGATVYITQIKLEKGTIATPYCPSSSEALYTTMGLNSTIEYDCSGFCNNGMRTGTFTWTSDTPKYNVSTEFAKGAKITSPTGMIIASNPIFTCNFWINTPTGTYTRYSDVITFNGSVQFRMEVSDTTGTQLIWFNYPIGTANGITTNGTVSNDTWNMFTITCDGSNWKTYKNGVLATTTAITGTAWTPDGTVSLGDSGTMMKISDVRIYATALSADDVKSLYQNSAYIDSSGNIYGAVHSEV